MQAPSVTMLRPSLLTLCQQQTRNRHRRAPTSGGIGGDNDFSLGGQDNRPRHDHSPSSEGTVDRWINGVGQVFPVVPGFSGPPPDYDGLSATDTYLGSEYSSEFDRQPPRGLSPEAHHRFTGPPHRGERGYGERGMSPFAMSSEDGDFFHNERGTHRAHDQGELDGRWTRHYGHREFPFGDNDSEFVTRRRALLGHERHASPHRLERPYRGVDPSYQEYSMDDAILEREDRRYQRSATPDLPEAWHVTPSGDSIPCIGRRCLLPHSASSFNSVTIRRRHSRGSFADSDPFRRPPMRRFPSDSDSSSNEDPFGRRPPGRSFSDSD